MRLNIKKPGITLTVVPGFDLVCPGESGCVRCAGNRDDFMDYETALSIFRWIAEERYLEQDAADAA